VLREDVALALGDGEPVGSSAGWARHPASTGANRRRPKARLQRIHPYWGPRRRKGVWSGTGRISAAPGPKEPATLFSALKVPAPK
jgi:hypothetical protein